MHFKFCSIKFNYVVVAYIVAVYYVLISAYHANNLFVNTKKSSERIQDTYEYSIRLVIQLFATICLAWGVAFLKTNGLLIWLFVAVCFIVRDATRMILFSLKNDEKFINFSTNISIGFWSICECFFCEIMNKIN